MRVSPVAAALFAWAVPFLVALATSYLAVAGVRRWLVRRGVLDLPGPRSSHRVPTPRGGGLGMVAGFLAGLWLGLALHPLAPAGSAGEGWGASLGGWLGGACLVALVGWLDDLRSLSARLRLAAQLLAAGLLVATVGAVDALRLPLVGELRLGPLGVPLTLLWVVAVTNIYNFMDGIDGLAGGQAAIAGLWMFAAALQTGHTAVGLLSLCLAGTALGFLAHNLPPARVFMGDVGSTFLGYAFAGLAVLGAQPGPSRISIVVSALLLAPFLFDATLTLAARMVRGERWYEPHRRHLYQRLVAAGYSHLRVSLMYYLLALVLGGLGLVEIVTGQGATLWFLLAGLAPLLALLVWVWRVEARSRQVGGGAARA